jgi:hypothetical protein
VSDPAAGPLDQSRRRGGAEGRADDLRIRRDVHDGRQPRRAVGPLQRVRLRSDPERGRLLLHHPAAGRRLGVARGVHADERRLGVEPGRPRRRGRPGCGHASERAHLLGFQPHSTRELRGLFDVRLRQRLPERVERRRRVRRPTGHDDGRERGRWVKGNHLWAANADGSVPIDSTSSGASRPGRPISAPGSPTSPTRRRTRVFASSRTPAMSCSFRFHRQR